MSRLHTAAVLVAGVAHRHWQCDVSSCSLSQNGVRLDFTCGPRPLKDVEKLFFTCNAAIDRGGLVTTQWIGVKRAEECVALYRSAATSRKVQNRPGRIVEIESDGQILERQFDVGTHVQNIREVVEVQLGPGNGVHKKILENKGNRHFRIRFHLRTLIKPLEQAVKLNDS